MELLPTFAQTHKDIAPLVNQVHHADAFELLARIPDKSIDMVLADLPYGVTACKWDTPLPLEPLWTELKRIAKPRAAIVLTATQPFTSRLVSSNYEMFKQEIIWEKDGGAGFLNSKIMHMPQHENILLFGMGKVAYYPQMTRRHKPLKYTLGKKSPLYGDYRPYSNITTFKYPSSVVKFSVMVEQTNKYHPTQKPVALFEYLIKTYTRENEIVLDMTCGSGTTAIAARKCGRQFICGDLELDYVELARKRLQDTDPYQDTELGNGQKQLSLFSKLEVGA
jgi:site-specific DNA-methyltransferase (adenine-specific)